MSLPLDVRPGVPGASPQPDQSEQPSAFEQVYADLDTYFFQQMLSPTYESVDYTLEDGAEQDFIFDIADTGIDTILDGSEIQIPISKFHVPDRGFIKLSDTDLGRVIRFGVTFWSYSAKPDESFGIELNLAERGGTISIFESEISLDENTDQEEEERLKTEIAQLSPDQMRKIAQVLQKYSPGGQITHQVKRRYG